MDISRVKHSSIKKTMEKMELVAIHVQNLDEFDRKDQLFLINEIQSRIENGEIVFDPDYTFSVEFNAEELKEDETERKIQLIRIVDHAVKEYYDSTEDSRVKKAEEETQKLFDKAKKELDALKGLREEVQGLIVKNITSFAGLEGSILTFGEQIEEQKIASNLNAFKFERAIKPYAKDANTRLGECRKQIEELKKVTDKARKIEKRFEEAVEECETSLEISLLPTEDCKEMRAEFTSVIHKVCHEASSRVNLAEGQLAKNRQSIRDAERKVSSIGNCFNWKQCLNIVFLLLNFYLLWYNQAKDKKWE